MKSGKPTDKYDDAEVCKLQDDLQDSERRYRCLFEGSKDMIFITFKDGSFQDVNQAAVDLLGYDSKQELLSLGSAEKVYDNVMHWEVFQRQIDRDGFVKDFEAKFKKKTVASCTACSAAMQSGVKTMKLSAIRGSPRILRPAWMRFKISGNAIGNYGC